jgi:hypothetical protein
MIMQTFSVEETFKGYESLGEAYEALSRIAKSCAEQKDGVHRQFNVVMESEVHHV